VSVLIEAINVIVRCETVVAKYPGGLHGYASSVPNRTFCDDGFIARVGFMKPDDVGIWTSHLAAFGFTLQRPDESFDEIAVIDERTGATRRCDWLGYGELFEPLAQFVHLLTAGEKGRADIFAPGNWEPLDEPFNFVPNEEIDRLQFIESTGGVGLYIDLEKVAPSYVADAFPLPPEQTP